MTRDNNKRVIKIGDFRINDAISKNIESVLSSQMITEGDITRRFEQRFSKISGKDHSVAVNSGTSALILSLKGLVHTINNGADTSSDIYRDYINSHYERMSVITTPTTYIASVNAIIHACMMPSFIDIHIPSLLITPDKIREKIEECEKMSIDLCGVLPVHLFGQMCDMDEINKIAKINNLFVLEDAAQAHGSIYKGRPAGSFGDVSIFSFYIAHNIAAGELGIASSNNYEIIKYIRSMKSNGRLCTCNICTRMTGKCPNKNSDIDPRFTHKYIGYNFKTMDLISSIALAQIDDIKNIINVRQENVKYLNDNIADMTNIFYLPTHRKDISYLAYPLILKEEYTKNIDIAYIRSELENRRIETRPIFPSIPTRQPAYLWLKREYEERLPNANYVGNNGFYIGCHQYINNDDLEYIVNSFLDILNNIKEKI